MKISTVLDQIDDGSIALPVFQRGYVWNRNQVRGLLRSLYLHYPVGSLIVWTTKTETAKVRGDGTLAEGVVDLLLDGQQRMTSLYGVVRGREPRFFDGDKNTFIGLHFNLEDESFEFYAPLKMKNQSKWVSVTDVMKTDLGVFVQRVAADYVGDPRMSEYLGRLTKLAGIKDIELHIEKVTGADKTIKIVVDIFNAVNQGGTKLSQGDLALAKINATWPDAREQMKTSLAKWEAIGYHFSLDWLLRNINAVINGEALFPKLADVSALTFQKGLKDADRAVNILLDLIRDRLGLDHDRVLGGRYALPVMSRYLALRGGHLADVVEQDRLLFWYVHSFLWGRFSGSTESVLDQDLRLLKSDGQDLDRLIAQIQQFRGDLQVRPQDFNGSGQGGRFYPLLYLLTRVGGAQDWDTGVALKTGLLGHTSSLQVHHIFPKAQLYKHKYNRAEVNAVANFCFLTQSTNLRISDKKPEDYFPPVEQNHPGTLASQWVPMNPELWKIANYREFLEARRVLLAQAANQFLDSLRHDLVVAPSAPRQTVTISSVPLLVMAADSEEDDDLDDFAEWAHSLGAPRPEVDYELPRPDPAQPPIYADLAWPDGVQVGLTPPTALVLQADPVAQTFSDEGFRVFRDTKALRQHLTGIFSQENTGS